MHDLPDLSQQIRWLLKEKYHWSTQEISQFLDQFQQGHKQSLSPEVTHDILRLQEGEPIAYVIGWVNFLGNHIDLSQKTLIPRPETEYWVETVINELRNGGAGSLEKPLRILDLCCGSGCIGISFLKAFPHATVDFSDIDPKAVEQTVINLKLNYIKEERSHVFEGNLFEHISGTYDIILSNPPYVDFSGEVGEETRYEPQLAIFTQNKGLELINQILLKSKNYLKNEGKLYFEFGEGQEGDIALLAKEAEVDTIEFREDQFGVKRFTKLTYRHQN